MQTETRSPGPSALAARVAAAEAWDWESLYDSVTPALLCLGTRRFGLRREDCEEALQKVALEIAVAAPLVRNQEAYLTTAFLRECVRIARETRARAARDVEPDSPASPLSDDPTSRLEAACEFNRALAHVPPICRELLTAWAIEGHTYEEAAGKAAVSKATIYKRLPRCLKKLTDALV